MHGDWSTHQLAEFLATVTAFPDERAATTGALERAAAAFEAEVAAVVRGASVTASIGFPDGETPEAELLAAAKTEACELPELGRCQVAAVPLEDGGGATFLLARLGDEAFSSAELNLLRAMARVLDLALRMLRTLEEERALRRRAEDEATERRRAERHLATQQAVARMLAGSMPAGGVFSPLLATLAGELGGEAGAVWLSDERSGSVRCAGVWRSSSLGAADASPAAFGYPTEAGLARRVLAEGGGWSGKTRQERYGPEPGLEPPLRSRSPTAPRWSAR